MRHFPAAHTPQASQHKSQKWLTYSVCKREDYVNCKFDSHSQICLTHHRSKNGRRTPPKSDA